MQLRRGLKRGWAWSADVGGDAIEDGVCWWEWGLLLRAGSAVVGGVCCCGLGLLLWVESAVEGGVCC